MGKKEQVPALAIFVQGSLWVWSATSRGRRRTKLVAGTGFIVESVVGADAVVTGVVSCGPAVKVADPVSGI